MFVRSAILALVLALPRAAKGAVFTYDPIADNGPGRWGQLNTTKPNQCDGKENSPIAIEDMDCTIFEDIVMEPGACTMEDLTYLVNDHSVKADITGDCAGNKPYINIPGMDGKFVVAQFHIHTGSEHTVDGVTFGAELHIVHLMENCPAGTQRCYAVVGTKINPATNENDVLFQQLLGGWVDLHNAQETSCNEGKNQLMFESVEVTTIVNPYQFNMGHRFFFYPGSLTTPPCSEMVYWVLDDKPLPVSPEQYANLGHIIMDYRNSSTCEKATVAFHGSTSRPTRPLWGRKVEKICPSSQAAAGSNMG